MRNITYNNSFFSQNSYLTYHEKLKKEIEKIPQTKKKFFIQSLAKHKFDSDVYIPQWNEKNRKINPEKDYLLNKIILYDNKLNKDKKDIDTLSKDFSKFFKFYNHLKESNNSNQRDFMNNLANIYKEKNKNNEKDIDYKINENIFSKSVLLDCDNSNKIDNIFQNVNDKINLTNDEKILISLDRVIHNKMSPNSTIKRNRNETNNFITSINQSYYTNKNNKTKSDKLKTDVKNESNIIENIKDKRDKSTKKLNKVESKKELKISNKKTKSNTLDKYIINSRLLKINKQSRNKNMNNDNPSSSKNNINNEYIPNSNNVTSYFRIPGNFSRLKNLFFSENKRNISEKGNLNIKTIKTIKNNEKMQSNDIFNNDSQNSKYLLTTLNKIQLKDEINNISIINKNKTILNQDDENNKSKNNISKSTLKRNTKINLPDINSKKENLNKSTNFKTIKEANINNKLKKRNKLLIKKEKSNNNFNNKKTKERDINNIYTTISTNSYFFREYPYTKIKNYFKKYKNISIKKVEPEKGSNLYPILDNIENIVKSKDIPQLAKSLDETKEYLLLKKTKKEKKESIEEKNMSYFEKVNENEKLFPLIKYECADKIIFN